MEPARTAERLNRDVRHHYVLEIALVSEFSDRGFDDGGWPGEHDDMPRCRLGNLFDRVVVIGGDRHLLVKLSHRDRP